MAIRPAARSDVNRTAILAHLGAHGPVSRAELARALAVSPALITQLTRDLLHDGLLVELEHSPSQGGRPARLLGLVTSAGRAIGVKISADHLAFVEVGIDGRVMRSAREPFDAASSTFLIELTAQLRRFVASDEPVPLLGIGIGLPGIVDQQDNGLVDSVQLGWQQVPLGATLRRELALPVIIENNVNALAFAERLYGTGRQYRNFLVVTIGTGVGLGIVVDGTVLRGAGGGAGELGHVPVDRIDRDGTVRTAELESFIGEQALIERGRQLGALGAQGGIAALQAAADAGDPAAAAVYEEAGYLLGKALAGAVQLLDPEAVLLLGEGTAAWGHWSFGFERAFRSMLMAGRRGVPVSVEHWQDESWAQGAAALVLASPFDTAGVAGKQGRLVRERLVEQSSPQGGTA